LGERRKRGDLFWKQKTPHLAASVVLSPHPSAIPSGSGSLGEGSGSGCRTGEDADLGGCAPPSLELADLEMGVPTAIPMASEAEERPLCCGGEEEEDLSETSSSMPRSPGSTSTLPTLTWRSFRWRVSSGGAVVGRRGAQQRRMKCGRRFWARPLADLGLGPLPRALIQDPRQGFLFFF